MNGLDLTSKTHLNLNTKETQQALEPVYIQYLNLDYNVWKAIRWEMDLKLDSSMGTMSSERSKMGQTMNKLQRYGNSELRIN